MIRNIGTVSLSFLGLSEVVGVMMTISIFKLRGFGRLINQLILLTLVVGLGIAISQAVLRHIPKADRILQKMIDSVKDNGLVVCMEGDLEIEKNAQYISGFDYNGTNMPSLYRKMYRNE